ncbi:hypothetical protein Nmn1133_09255 [Halosegnis longus]|uniref:Uncharacterized protein n=1 Tax=Halosegnis longus TaxID=2216012 RepID=A0AAJ4UWV9_9EURY|nr:hypothetical protein Nmn1133_09255 [Salella cibi]
MFCLSLAAVSTTVAFVGRALAHSGSLGANAGRGVAVPTWLFLATGGGVVGVSFVLSSLATDREFLRYVHEYRRTVGTTRHDLLVGLGRAVGLLGLVVVLATGFLAGRSEFPVALLADVPADPLRNAAILLVWGGWWAGLAMSSYLVGNSWPVLNPFRTIAGWLPSLDRELPVDGGWLATVGLLTLIWVEVVSPLADAAQLLATAVALYGVVTVLGGVVVGDDYFTEYDPVARVFDAYGRVAPLTVEDGSLKLRSPGAGLQTPWVDSTGDIAFIVALLWGTTYDGLVATAPWAGFARAVVGFGVPPVLLYPLVLAVGFAGFLGVYLLSIRYGRRIADTTLDSAALAARFAPSLLAIAAGYHVAHYLGYFLNLVPALANALANPLSPGQAFVLTIPGWFGLASLTFVIAGHVLAVWVAHGVGYELFPSRIQAVRSQYLLTLVMMFYTMTSLWIVSRPYEAPPFL